MASLASLDTRPPAGTDKETTRTSTEELLGELNELQHLLYAEGSHALLVVLQGLDASGKDGAIRNVFGRLNPQGVRVHSFKVPTAEEQRHDFLWRIHRQVPEQGMIQIFNRSHYEDVLVHRVHGTLPANVIADRYTCINDFERLLTRQGHTHLLKIYLHVSVEEQAERLAERRINPRKMWKYNPGDEQEAARRDLYLQAYDEVFARCNEVPWHIVPADKNWYKEHLLTRLVHGLLSGLQLQYPVIKPVEL